MKKQIAGIFGLLAGLLSVNLLVETGAAAHDNLTHEEINTPEECEALGRDDRYKEDHYWEVDYDLQGSACTHRYHFDDAAVCEHNGLYLIRGSIPLEVCECGEGETMRVVPGHELNECILTPIPQFPLHPTLTRPAEPEVGDAPVAPAKPPVRVSGGTPLVRTPDGVPSPAELVGNVVSELGIQSGGYAPVVNRHGPADCSPDEVRQSGECVTIEEHCRGVPGIFTPIEMSIILARDGVECPNALPENDRECFFKGIITQSALNQAQVQYRRGVTGFGQIRFDS